MPFLFEVLFILCYYDNIELSTKNAASKQNKKNITRKEEKQNNQLANPLSGVMYLVVVAEQGKIDRMSRGSGEAFESAPKQDFIKSVMAMIGTELFFV